MKYYFLKSIMAMGRQRVIPLPGQILNGVPIDVKFYCMVDPSIREAYPVGTVFAVSELIERVGYYEAPNVCPITEPAIKSEHGPAVEAEDQYQEYLKSQK